MGAFGGGAVVRVDQLGDGGDECFEFVNGGVNIDALLLQLGDLRAAAVDGREPLRAAVVAEVVEIEQFLDVGEAEADPAAAQDPGEAGAVASVTLPGDVSSIYLGGTFNNESIASGPVTVTKVVQGVRASITLANSCADANTVVTTAGTCVINGYSFNSSGSETVQSLANKINEMSSTTGVTAQISGSGPVQIVLNQNTYGSQHKIDLVDASNVLHNASTASAVGVDAVFDVSATTASGVQTVTFTGGRGPGESGLRISDMFGNSLVLTEAGNAGLAVPTQVGIVSSSGVMFQIGANTGQSVQFAMPAVFANRLGTNAVSGLSVADLDVTTPQGAQDAMKIIDDAINQLSQMRGELGSFQKNFLESTVRSLAVAQENLTASESQIRDVDMAMEITNYTKLQILQQSGMSVLAQANQAPQSVLQLLRGG